MGASAPEPPYFYAYDAERKTREAADIVFKVLGTTNWESNPVYLLRNGLNTTGMKANILRTRTLSFAW